MSYKVKMLGGVYTKEHKERYAYAFKVWCYLFNRKLPQGFKICDMWKSFENFANWFEENRIEGCPVEINVTMLSGSKKTYAPEYAIVTSKSINTYLNKKSSSHMAGISRVGRKYQVRFDGRFLGSFVSLNSAIQRHNQCFVNVLRRQVEECCCTSEENKQKIYNYFDSLTINFY